MIGGRSARHRVHPTLGETLICFHLKDCVNVKVKVRIQGSEEECKLMRRKLLADYPELILSKPREGSNPKYEGNQKWACYGDFHYFWTPPGPKGKYEPVIRRRRS